MALLRAAEHRVMKPLGFGFYRVCYCVSHHPLCNPSVEFCSQGFTRVALFQNDCPTLQPGASFPLTPTTSPIPLLYSPFLALEAPQRLPS